MNKIINKKIIILIVLMALFSLTFSVFAWMVTMDKEENGTYKVNTHLNKGWNLIPGTILQDGIFEDSSIKLSDISAIWYYSPIQKKYIQIYPNTDWDGIMKDDEDFVLTSAMWIYSKKSGMIKYSTLEDYPSLENRQLYVGWNLISMTPDIIEGPKHPDLTFEEIIGTCNVEKAYYFFDGDWALFDMPEMDSTLLGKGMAIKVINDCKLGK